jgi:hypothetical protein
MGYWDYEEPYWEPGESDELFDEMKSKLIDAAKASIKSDMESLKSRNEYLENRNRELEQRERAVDQKERDLGYKADNLRREVEREFYKTAIEDIFKDAIEESTLWFADRKPHTRPKCDLCDEDRKWTHIWPNGEEVHRQCDCATLDYWYEPQESMLAALKYKVRDSNYPSERYYRLDKSHNVVKSNWYDDYSYSDFRIQFVYDQFCDDVITQHKKLGYGARIGFKAKEECQKYCDWLNNKNEEDDDEYDIE